MRWILLNMLFAAFVLTSPVLLAAILLAGTRLILWAGVYVIDAAARELQKGVQRQ